MAVPGAAVTTTGGFHYPGTTIIMGTGENNRIGSSIRARSLKGNLLFIYNTSSAVACRVNILIGAWRDYQIAPPTNTSFYQNSTDPSISHFLREPLQNKEWIPMYRRDFILGDANVDGVYPSQKIIRLSFSGKKLPMKKKTFNAGGTVNWQYFVYAWSDHAVANNPPQMYTEWRMTFTDV